MSAAACSYVGWNIVDGPCKVYTGGMCSSEHCLVYTRNKIIVKEYRVVNVRIVLEQGRNARIEFVASVQLVGGIAVAYNKYSRRP